jgi:hypothetical protein
MSVMSTKTHWHLQNRPMSVIEQIVAPDDFHLEEENVDMKHDYLEFIVNQVHIQDYARRCMMWVSMTWQAPSLAISVPELETLSLLS